MTHIGEEEIGNGNSRWAPPRRPDGALIGPVHVHRLSILYIACETTARLLRLGVKKPHSLTIEPQLLPSSSGESRAPQMPGSRWHNPRQMSRVDFELSTRRL